MPEKRTTVYHSGLSGPIRLKVMSDALVSKYAEKKNLGPNDPGYYYLFVEIEGERHTYSAENQRCAKVLEGYKDQEITISAVGRGDGATIEIKGATEASAPPAPNPPKEERPKPDARSSGKRSIDAHMIAAELANEFRDVYNLEYKDTPMSECHFVEVIRSQIIQMSQDRAI